MKTFIRALFYKNYCFFFVGQAFSLIGTWITQVATVWLVYQLTSSVFLLGLGGFAGQVPNFVIAPFGGILADQWSPRRILVITQTLSMIQSLALAALALTGTIQVWHIILLSVLQGVINAFDIPARQTFVRKVVENKEDLGNAIALNSSLVNGARLIGPAIAGLLITAVGVNLCFLIDSVSYVGVIAVLLAMKTTPRTISSPKVSSWHRLKEGFTYAFEFPCIRSILFLLALVSFIGMPYTVLVPIVAIQLLNGSSDTLGFLMASSGVGALIGSIYLSCRQTSIGLEKIMVFSPTTLGIGLVALSLSRSLKLSLLIMLLIGFSITMQIVSSNTFLQTIVEDDKRGRVMSLYTMLLSGTLPFGNLLVAGLADEIGISNTLVISGFFCVLGSFIFKKQLLKGIQHIQARKDELVDQTSQTVATNWRVVQKERG
ncbi:MAG: MFS transporter [Cyanobacteria bacterium]|jgi:MFS family permease|nr:MFS transporter [Cyanobacteria bacterium GSL.Bin21]